MSIMVGSARIDENGRASGGAAGDQKQSSTPDYSGEISMQPMYTHSKGWYILRPKSVNHANKIAANMMTACNNKNIGYDQGGRLGVVSKGVNATRLTESDCSSLVRECVKEATGKDPGNFTTANEVTALEATGLFNMRVAYINQSATPVYNGDVLVTKTKGHTVIVVSGNPRSGGSSTTPTSGSTYKVKSGDTLSSIASKFGTTVNSIVSINKSKYPKITPDYIEAGWVLQVRKSGTAPSSGKLTVDGVMGKDTTKKAQRYFGTPVDGVISNQLSAYKSICAGIISAEWNSAKKGGSDLVEAIQKWVGATQDGYLGPNTIKKWQKKMGTVVDGVISNPSQCIKAFQKWLNEQEV